MYDSQIKMILSYLTLGLGAVPQVVPPFFCMVDLCKHAWTSGVCGFCKSEMTILGISLLSDITESHELKKKKKTVLNCVFVCEV